MSETNVVPQADGPVQRNIPEHSCYEWNHIGYHITPDYTSAYCLLCESIVGFKWRKPWRRFVSLFTDEPTLRKEMRFKLWKLREKVTWNLWRRWKRAPR